MKIVSLQLPEELLLKVKEDADKEYMSLSAYVRKLIILYYKNSSGN